MRNLFFSILLLTLVRSVSAHAQPGSTLLIGTVSYNSSNDMESEGNISRVRDFLVSPAAGYQANRHFIIGVSSSFGVGKTSANGEVNKFSSFRVGPLLRYTGNFTERLYAFVQLEASYLTGQNRRIVESQFIDRNVLYNGFSTMAFPAVGFHFAGGVSLFAAFGGIEYKAVNYEGLSRHYDAVNFTLGQQLSVGITKTFHPRGRVRSTEASIETPVIDTKDDDETPEKAKPEE